MRLKKVKAPTIVTLPASELELWGEKVKGVITLYPHALDILHEIKKKELKGKKIDRVIFVNDIFLENRDRKETFRLSIGGYGSGKSYDKALEYILLSMRKEYFRALYVRKNSTDIRDSQFLLFKDIINEYQLNQYFTIQETEMNITCKFTGHILMAAGLSEVTQLKGINNITHVWYEEPINKARKKKKKRADITREDFETLNLRVRTEKAELHIDMTANPISKDTWVYEDFFHPTKAKYKVTTDPNKPQEAFYLKTTYLDNYFASEKQKRDMERLTGDEALIGRLGEWAGEKTGYEWLNKYSTIKHTGKCVYYKDLTVHLSFDFNMLPYQTMLAIQTRRYYNKVKNKEILQVRVFKEYCMTPPLNSPKFAIELFEDEYLDNFGFNAVSIYGDCSGKYGVDNYIDIESHLEKYLASDGNMVGDANPNRHIIRDIINDILDDQYDIEILVDKDKCPNLINDMANLQTDVKGFDPEKEDGIESLGHTYSALAYFIAQYFQYLLTSKK